MKSDQEEVVENRESGNNGRGEREGRKMRTHGAMWKFKGDKKKKKGGGKWFGGRGPGRDVETEYISQYSEKK